MPETVYILEGERLRLTIDTARGGSITDLRGGVSGDQWLLQEPARREAWPPNHAVYDDVWSGGFEELFPNDAPGEFDGRSLPDHGELWNHPFDIVDTSTTTLLMRRDCTSVNAIVEKSIVLDAHGAGATITYRLTNRDRIPLWHLFKLHAAMRVETGDQLLLPGGTVTPVEPGFGALSSAGSHAWPIAHGDDGRPLDLSIVRAASDRFREFVYVSELPAGACGLRRARTGESFVIEYPLSVFPHCWLFITYGGWRDYNTVVLEPCTNRPKDLTAARSAGACAVLAAGETREFSIRTAIRGFDAA